MKLRTVVTIAIILGPILGGASLFGWWRDRTEWSEDKARSDSTIAALQSAIDFIEEVRDSVVADADSVIAERNAKVDSLRRSERIWKRESAKTRGVLGVVLRTVDDSVAERINSVVDNLEAQHEERVGSLVLALASKDSIIGEWRKKYEVEARLNRQLQVAWEESQIEINHWQNQAKPSFLEKYKDNPIVLATGVGIGILVDQLFFNKSGETVIVQNEHGH